MVNKIVTNFEKDIYQKYYPLVFSNCKKRITNQSLVEDAVQSTFLLYIREQNKIHSNLSSWLYWASTNVCIVIKKNEQKQKKWLETKQEDEKIFPENQDLQEKEIFADLSKVIDTLPKKKQEMLMMKYFDGMSYEQIANHFKSTEEAARKTIERTLDNLKEKLDKKDIVFSVLLPQFYQNGYVAEGLASTLGVKAQSFILQNTVNQQIIANSVQKMLLFSKLKFALVAFICLTVPISAVVFSNKKEHHQKNILNVTPNMNKDLVGVWKLNPSTTLAINQDGSFKLTNQSSNHPNDECLLTIDENGTFQFSNPKVNGKYTYQNDSFFIFTYGNISTPFKVNMINKFHLSFESITMKMNFNKYEAKQTNANH